MEASFVLFCSLTVLAGHKVLSARLANSPSCNVWRNHQALLLHLAPMICNFFFCLCFYQTFCTYNNLYQGIFKRMLQKSTKTETFIAVNPPVHHNQEVLPHMGNIFWRFKSLSSLFHMCGHPSIGTFRLSAAFDRSLWPPPVCFLLPPPGLISRLRVASATLCRGNSEIQLDPRPPSVHW